MDWEMIRLDNEFGKTKMSRKKRIVVVIVFLVVLHWIFITDDRQQWRFATLENSYELMESGKYEEAVEGFEEYLSVDSELYWKLMERVNGYEYSKKYVEQMIETCLAEI